MIRSITSSNIAEQLFLCILSTLTPIKANDGESRDSQVIANCFNDFFVTKIENLKSNIDKNLIEDPLQKLKEMANKGLHFFLKM